MASSPPPFLPGDSLPEPGPLSRFLPPVPGGVAAAWLAQSVSPSSARGDSCWILDPFGASPQLAVEAARQGYSVLVAANNPVARFLLELAASPPGEQALQAALAVLAASFKGDERLEPHIRLLYRTECAQCRQEVEAEDFLWERGASVPYARIYTCPYCGDAGERPATEADAARAQRFSASSALHRSRALERVAPASDPDRVYVEEALNAYLPRAIYAAFTVINKLAALPETGGGNTRRYLEALLIPALDQANNLWSQPSSRSRPRQLTTLTTFREHNFWMALEAAVLAWPAVLAGPPVPLTIWPTPPPSSGGICLFEGRLKDLSEQIAAAAEARRLRVGAVISALPRPNQAFWSLSALWAGWLWGAGATAPFKTVLRRRRYDWGWHSTALHAVMTHLAACLAPGTPFLGLVGENEPGFLSAALISGRLAGFELDGTAVRLDSGQAQISWRLPGAPPQPDEPPAEAEIAASTRSSLQAAAQAAARQCLLRRGIPSDYLFLHAAALEAMLATGSLPRTPADAVSLASNICQNAFSYRGGFLRFNGSDHSLDVGQWWLREAPISGGSARQAQPEAEKPAEPLADRVEIAVVRLLQKNPGISLPALDAAVCKAFPGLETPDRDLVEACLRSYALPDPTGKDAWTLQPQDEPRVRREELAQIRELALRVGGELGFTPSTDPANPANLPAAPIYWSEHGGKIIYVIYIVASAVIGKIIFQTVQPASARPVLVYPGGRAGLLDYKLTKDPRLRQQVDADWLLVKYRLLRRLAENRSLNRANLEEQLAIDPIASDDPQMPLL